MAKRLTGITFLLIIVAMAFILAGIVLYAFVFDSKPICGAPAITTSASGIALRDSYIQQYLESADNYSVWNARGLSPDYYCYSDGAKLAVVPIMVNRQGVEDSILVTVNPYANRTVSIYFNSTPPGITYGQQMEATKVAFNDAGVKGWLAGLADEGALHYSVPVIRGVQPSGFQEYGYVRPSGPYVDVPIQAGTGVGPMIQYLQATVNLSDDTVAITKQSFGESLMGSVVSATIPPGQSFYREYYAPMRNLTLSDHMLTGTGLSSNYLVIEQQPDDVCIRAMVVDRENLSYMRNGSSFSELNSASYDVSGNRWSISVPAKTEFYLVLKNEDTKRAVNVTIPYRPL